MNKRIYIYISLLLLLISFQSIYSRIITTNDLKEAENIELDELDSRYYYLCGVSPSMALEKNFHLAFEECEGNTIEYSFNGIDVKIKNAKRVEFSADDINWDVEHSDEELYNRCRNWQFAHKVSNGGENTKFK